MAFKSMPPCFTLLAFVTSFLICLTSAKVPLDQFFDYGISVGDSQLPRFLDETISFPIAFDYPYFGSTYTTLGISSNGIITFGFEDRSFIPMPFPLLDMHCIASYWVDTDPSRGEGDTHYRQTFDDNTLNRITDKIRNNFVNFQSFTSQWALIVTLENLPAYGNNPNSTCWSANSSVVTFQTVLTTNGIHSFAIFYYNRLDYTVGTDGCDAHAQIGFNAGDGIRYHLIPMSNTANISMVALTQSNIGVPGQWMFSTHEDEIPDGCNDRGLLEIYPRKVLYYGNEEVVITGPCFAPSETMVTVFFQSSVVSCQVNSAQQAVCRTPLLDKMGRNEIRIDHQNSITYNSFIIAVSEHDASVMENAFFTLETSNPNTQYQIEWTVGEGEPAHITFRGYQKDFYVNSKEEIVDTETTLLNYGEHQNSGKVLLDTFISSKQHLYSKVIREMLVSGLVGNKRRIAGKVVILINIVSDNNCVAWYDQQPLAQEMEQIWDQVARRSPCPPGVAPHFPPVMDNFEEAGRCKPSGVGCPSSKPTFTGCYWSTNNAGGKVSHCCYEGTDNSLVLGPTDGGNMHFVDAAESITRHFIEDDLPYLTCCKLTYSRKKCDMYYEKRPSFDSTYFRSRNGSGGGGDPHFTTLDGTKYTFNPIGEFIYMIAGSGAQETTIQVRISQYKRIGGNLTSGTYFSAFVIRSGFSDVVQVELSASQTFVFRVNGQSVILDEGLWNFDGISISYQNNATVMLRTTSGHSIELEIQISGRMLHAILNLPLSLKGDVHGGLVGDWDSNNNNDLKLPDGSFISRNSSNYIIHYSFGMAWSTKNSTSLFQYPRGLNWSDYQDKDFVPDFSTPSSDDLLTCGGNTECAYDLHLTGDLAAARSNLAREERVAKVNVMNYDVSITCPTNVAIANGAVSVSSDETTTRYTVTCYEGYMLVGSASSVCIGGAFSPLGICQSMSAGLTLIPNFGYVGHTFIALIIAFMTMQFS